MERFATWISQLDDVRELQAAVNANRAWFVANPSKMDLDASWAQRVQKAHADMGGDTVDKVARFQMMLTPALEMVQAMQYCSTPCQKVRLWAEAILEAISLINMQIGENAIGGPDVPSIVLFLTCINDCDNLVVQAKLARLFCLDNYDQKEFKLPEGGLYLGMEEQYAFAAEERAIDHSHYLLWAEDTLRIIAEEDTSGDADGEPTVSHGVCLLSEVEPASLQGPISDALGGATTAARAVATSLQGCGASSDVMADIEKVERTLQATLKGEVNVCEVGLAVEGWRRLCSTLPPGADSQALQLTSAVDTLATALSPLHGQAIQNALEVWRSGELPEGDPGLMANNPRERSNTSDELAEMMGSVPEPV